jgi:hypothetical protein
VSPLQPTGALQPTEPALQPTGALQVKQDNANADLKENEDAKLEFDSEELENQVLPAEQGSAFLLGLRQLHHAQFDPNDPENKAVEEKERESFNQLIQKTCVKVPRWIPLFIAFFGNSRGELDFIHYLTSQQKTNNDDEAEVWRCFYIIFKDQLPARESRNRSAREQFVQDYAREHFFDTGLSEYALHAIIDQALTDRVPGSKKREDPSTRPFGRKHFCLREHFCAFRNYLSFCDMTHEADLKAGDILYGNFVRDLDDPEVFGYAMVGADSISPPTFVIAKVGDEIAKHKKPLFLPGDLSEDQLVYARKLQWWKDSRSRLALTFSQLQRLCLNTYRVRIEYCHCEIMQTLIEETRKNTYLDLFLGGCLHPKIVECISRWTIHTQNLKMISERVLPQARFLEWILKFSPQQIQTYWIALQMKDDFPAFKDCSLEECDLVHRCFLFCTEATLERPANLPSAVDLQPFVWSPKYDFRLSNMSSTYTILHYILNHGGNTSRVHPRDTFEKWLADQKEDG